MNEADNYQFGFKKGFSTGTCTYVFKQTFQYYRQRGSHVFCCFIDFSKAFDNVNYWMLFRKLLDYNNSNTCVIPVSLLAFWYSHQEMYVPLFKVAFCHHSFFEYISEISLTLW